MLVCECGFEAGSGAGLAAHRRACQDGAAQTDVSVFEAARRDLPAGPPSALAAAVLKVARLIDLSESPRDVPSLTKELRALLAEVVDVEEPDDVDVVDELERRRAGRVG